MIVAPCKDCPDKGCGPRHDTCEKYKEYRAAKDAQIAAKQAEHWINDLIGDGIQRNARRRRSRREK